MNGQTPTLRTAMVCASLLLLAACGGTAPTALITEKATPSSPTPGQPDNPLPPVDHQAPTCTPTHVSVTRLSTQWSKATQEDGVLLVLGNSGRGPCNLEGYARVVLRDNSGPLPLTYIAEGFAPTDPRTLLVTLRPGTASAQIIIARSRCATGDERTATQAQVALPGATVTTTLNLPPGTGLSTCKHPVGDAPPRIYIGPVQYLWPNSL